MSGNVVDWFPPSWLDVEFLEPVKEYIWSLPIDPVDKKKAFHSWSRYVDYSFTAQDIVDVTGVPAGEI